MPTFSMLEYANNRFNAYCLIRNRLAATTVIVPDQRQICPANCEFAAVRIVVTCMMAYSAQFNSAPDSKAEDGAGASEWASGSQPCSGNMPHFVP